MRCIAVLSSFALAACASGGVSTSNTRPETTRVVGAGGATGVFATTAITAASVSTVAAPLDRAWRLMPAVYDSLGIPLTTVDPAKHLIGNEGLKIRTRLKNVPLSKYIDCGQAQIGPSADSYDIFLTVTTVLRSMSPTETQVATTVDAQGKPISFSQEYSRCSSKGAIETSIASILAARLATGK
jgi:hypothetical protein